MNLSDLVTAYDNGQYLTRSFSKAPTQATGAGIWFDLSSSPGNPVPQYYFASPFVATALARSTDGGIDHGPLQAGYTKYIHKLLLNEALAAAPISVEILDYLMYYPGIAMDTGPQALTTNIALPRYPTGSNVQIMAIEQNSYVGGASFFLTYTNQDGTSGKITPTVTCNAQLVPGTVATSALATAGCTGRFIPLATGDTGVRSIDIVEFTSADVGLIALVLVRPIARATIYELTAPAEIDFLQDFGYLPQIVGDAYLNMIVKPQGSLAAAPITGELTTVWSNT